VFRKFGLPLLALGLLAFAVYHVLGAQRTPPRPPPVVEPARSPFARTVAASGLVEAQTENISVGTHLPGVVAEVHVKVGQQVKKGDPLFRLDDRHLQAERAYRQASLRAAKAQLARLEQMPREEELPPSKAKVREARANLHDQQDQAERARKLIRSRAVAEEELVRREQAAKMAAEQLARAEAEYALLKAGAWAPDKEVARAAVTQAEAQLGQTETELERLTVRAYVEGEVLQVNVRPGEYVGAPPGQALVVLGSVKRLHVRVDVDEHDIPRFRPGAPARAAVRGDPRLQHDLKFVRVEPYVVPKKSLTGDNTERVDTRVLQVIYAVAQGRGRLYVGQQVDVFIEATEPSPGEGLPSRR
jgi:multidrug resistance efflux pump